MRPLPVPALLVWIGLVAQALPPATRPDSEARAALERGAALFTEHKLEEAARELRRSLALDPNQPRAEKLLGLTLQIAGKQAEAEQAFQRARRLDSKDSEAWFFLGRVLYLRNFFGRARQALETARKLNAAGYRIHDALALALEADGETERALASYREAVRLNRGDRVSPSPHFNYGALLLKLSRFEEAERQLKRAKALDPENWEAGFELGKLYFQTGRLEAAAGELKLALGCPSAKEDDKRRVRYLLGQVYLRMGREAEAAALAEER